MHQQAVSVGRSQDPIEVIRSAFRAIQAELPGVTVVRTFDELRQGGTYGWVEYGKFSGKGLVFDISQLEPGTRFLAIVEVLNQTKAAVGGTDQNYSCGMASNVGDEESRRVSLGHFFIR